MTGSSHQMVNLSAARVSDPTGSLAIMGGAGSSGLFGGGARTSLFKTHQMGAGNSLSASKPGNRGTGAFGRTDFQQEMQSIPEDGQVPASTMQVPQPSYLAPTAKNLQKL